MALRDDKIFSAIRLFRQSFGGYKLQIAVLITLGFLSGLLEGIGVNAIIPLFSFVSDSSDEITDTISQLIRNFFDSLGIELSLISLITLIITLFILKAVVLFIAHYITAKINTHYERRQRSQLLERSLKAEWRYLMGLKIGYLEKVLDHDIGGGAVLLRYLTDSILLITSLLMYTFIALNISTPITLITLTVGAFMFLLLKPIAYRTRIVAQRYNDTLKQVAHHVNEKMIGIKSVKAASVEKPIIDEGANYFHQLERARIKTALYNNVALSSIQPVAIIFVCGIFLLSYTSSSFNFASFAVIIYLIQKIFSYLQSVQGKLQNINELLPCLKSIAEYDRNAAKYAEHNTGVKKFRFEKQLIFENVSFAYGPDKPLLENLNLTVSRGEMVGLIGPSGAGKTTIVDLFLRLFTPQSGEITIDGINITEIDLTSWRKNIGYVSQEIFLVNETFRNNIVFYNQNLTDDAIIAAAKMANIHDFITSQPEGYDTVIGERGLLLSGGQRQRVILARALARQPQLLILDEATSALDNESEILIQKAIENLKGKMTVIAIAHRLSTVVNSDRIIVLEQGKITEEGDPKALLTKKKSYFYRLYNIRDTENKQL